MVEEFFFFNGMSIVETDQPFPVSGMQGQRIVEPMGFPKCCRNATDNELHPMTASWIDDYDLSIQQ